MTSPFIFHGISGAKTVPESPIVLAKVFFDTLNFLNDEAIDFPGIIIAKV